MRVSVLKQIVTVSVGLVALGASGIAGADVIPLSYTATASGTTGSGANTSLSVPGAHTFGNSLGPLTAAVYTVPGPGGQSYEFYDNYVFTISGGSANALTSSINLGGSLGLNDFQVRLYALGTNPLTPVFGTPAGGTIVQAWSTPVTFSPGMTGLLSVIPEQILGAGSYVLEVRGNVSGAAGGAYSGVLNVAPVPVPAAAWLLMSGLGMFGFMRKRR